MTNLFPIFHQDRAGDRNIDQDASNIGAHDPCVWERAYLQTRHGYLWFALRAHLCGLTPSQTVLEIGCGDGRNLGLLGKLGCQHVFGLDISERLLHLSRVNSVIQADAHYLPFGDDALELIFIDSVLHHCTDFRTVLEESYRVLAASGSLCFVEPCASILRRLLDLVTFSPLANLIPMIRHRRALRREEQIRPCFDQYTNWLLLEPRLESLLQGLGFERRRLFRDGLSVYGHFTVPRESHRGDSSTLAL